MKHEMKLNMKPFSAIKNGTKTIELRLLDDKRKKIKIGDTITFTNKDALETLKVEVINIYKYSSFKELYENHNKVSLGYKEDEEAHYKDMELYYSKSEQEKYGVVGIEINLLR